MEVTCGYTNHTPDEVGQVFCFEVYACIRCGRVARESVMSRPGVIWIDIKGNVTQEGV